MFSRDSLEYLVGLGATEIIEVDGLSYSTNPLHKVKYPKPESLKTTTLTALIDYIKADPDEIEIGQELIVHVESPGRVSLLARTRVDAERECFMTCQALTPNNIVFDRFMETEQFNIMLQSSFVENNARALLLKVIGNIKEEGIKQIGDDGVSQAATIKTGVASVNDVVVPNPVILAPYRTFPEIEQPESKFIFRMQSGPKAALYEADGGAWRNEAMKSIQEYLTEALKGIERINIIS
ncbi:MAG TPA: hypothetical protein VIK34_05885 [Clostridiaceae bacterium]